MTALAELRSALHRWQMRIGYPEDERRERERRLERAVEAVLAEPEPPAAHGDHAALDEIRVFLREVVAGAGDNEDFRRGVRWCFNYAKAKIDELRARPPAVADAPALLRELLDVVLEARKTEDTAGLYSVDYTIRKMLARAPQPQPAPERPAMGSDQLDVKDPFYYPKPSAEELAERKLWDQTLADGMEPQPAPETCKRRQPILADDGSESGATGKQCGLPLPCAYHDAKSAEPQASEAAKEWLSSVLNEWCPYDAEEGIGRNVEFERALQPAVAHWDAAPSDAMFNALRGANIRLRDESDALRKENEELRAQRQIDQDARWAAEEGERKFCRERDAAREEVQALLVEIAELKAFKRRTADALGLRSYEL